MHERYVGQTVPVFVESISAREQKRRDGSPAGNVELRWETSKAPEAQDAEQTVTQLSGRTAGDLIVMFEGDESFIGETIHVRIDRAAPLTLFGEMAPMPAAI